MTGCACLTKLRTIPVCIFNSPHILASRRAAAGYTHNPLPNATVSALLQMLQPVRGLPRTLLQKVWVYSTFKALWNAVVAHVNYK